MGEGGEEEWKKGLRARVTALKCHVMASKGLTPQGHIVPAYSPEVIMKDPENAAIMKQYNNPKEIKAYVTAAINKKIKDDPSMLDPGEIQLEMKESDVIVAENAWPPIEETQSVDKDLCPERSCQNTGSVEPNGSSNLSSIINDNNNEVKGLDFWQNGESDDEEDSPAANGYMRINALDCDDSEPGSPVKTPCDNHNEKPSVERTSSSVDSQEAVANSDSSCQYCNESKSSVEDLKIKVSAQQQQIEQLGNIRDEVENELQELTANLFQEAHSMVTAANLRTAAAEKSLTESKMAVDVLTGEVTALKAMVMTSTPSAPNPHLHPQLQSHSPPSNNNTQQLPLDISPTSSGATLVSNSSNSLPINISGLRIFHRGHKKSPSDFDLKYGRDSTPPSSPFKAEALAPSVLDCWEVDPVSHKEFISWHQSSAVFDLTDPFLRRVHEEDISLCLSFTNEVLSHALEKAVRDNDIFIEEVNARHQHTASQKCVLLDVARFCKYRFRLGSKQPYNWYYISQLARNRIIAVCDFLNYLRYIKQGLVKSSIHDMYREVVNLRRQMALARLGF